LSAGAKGVQGVGWKGVKLEDAGHYVWFTNRAEVLRDRWAWREAASWRFERRVIFLPQRIA
jgi:hypothetical protein